MPYGSYAGPPDGRGKEVAGDKHLVDAVLLEFNLKLNSRHSSKRGMFISLNNKGYNMVLDRRSYSLEGSCSNGDTGWIIKNAWSVSDGQEQRVKWFSRR